MSREISVSEGLIDGYESHQELIMGVVDVFEAFFDEFRARRGVSKADCKRLLKGKELTGRELRQEPEAFARQYLVHPLLDVFDYRYRTEPYLVDEGVKLDEISSNPDFQVAGVSYIHSRLGEHVEPLIIGEAKAVNRYEAAKEDIYEPTDSDEGYLDLAMPVEVGIATDGLNWGLFVCVPRSSIHNPVDRVEWVGEVGLNQLAAYAASQYFDTMPVIYDREEAHEQLEGFVKMWNQRRLPQILDSHNVGISEFFRGD